MAADKPVINDESEVTLHYRITLEDGTVADSTFEESPITFSMGDGTLLTSVEKLISGMSQGDESTFTLEPDQGFGYPDSENLHRLPLDDFGEETLPVPGIIISFNTPMGDDIPGMVLEVEDGEVLVDFNHPLSGHTLSFEVQVVAVTE